MAWPLVRSYDIEVSNRTQGLFVELKKSGYKLPLVIRQNTYGTNGCACILKASFSCGAEFCYRVVQKIMILINEITDQ